MKQCLSLVAFAAAGVMATPAAAHITLYQGGFAADTAGASGSGTLNMEYDADGHTLNINASWAGLSGNTTQAHIHCCTALANTGTGGIALAESGVLPGFPLGVKAGSYIHLIDLTLTSQYSAGFVTASGGTAAGAEARLISNLSAGKAYFNIHTATFGGGEIRTFVTEVPEPESYALMLAGLGLVGMAARRRQRV
jgi:hypothetical protein